MTVVALAVVLTFTSTGTWADDNLVVNGSFEEPAISGWGVFNSIPGWTKLSYYGIEVQNRVAGSPYDGNQHVEMDSYGSSAMRQFCAYPQSSTTERRV